ncbi:MAG: hypothetical protein ACK5R7_05100 [Armatimonadota bacterium]
MASFVNIREIKVKTAFSGGATTDGETHDNVEGLHEGRLLLQEAMVINLITGNALRDLTGHETLVLQKSDENEACAGREARILIDGNL